MGGFGLAGNTSKIAITGDKGQTTPVGEDSRLPVKEDPVNTVITQAQFSQLLCEVRKINEYLAEILGDKL